MKQTRQCADERAQAQAQTQAKALAKAQAREEAARRAARAPDEGALLRCTRLGVFSSTSAHSLDTHKQLQGAAERRAVLSGQQALPRCVFVRAGFSAHALTRRRKAQSRKAQGAEPQGARCRARTARSLSRSCAL